MAELYVSATFGVPLSHLFPDDGEPWEFRPAGMGYIDVFQHRADGTIVQRESILANIATLKGVKAEDKTAPPLTP